MDIWRRNLVAVTSASFVGFTGFTLVMPFLARYFQDLGVSDRGAVAIWTGLTLGVTPGVAALCGPFWGRIGDRYGNKVLVQRSLASFVVLMTLMAYASRPWHVFALRAMQGLVAGYGGLTIAMAALSAPPDRMAAAIGTVQTAQRVGPAIGPVLGGLLAAAVGLRRSFLVAAVVYGTAFLLVTLLYREPPRAAAHAERKTQVSFSSILALENFMLLMVVIFGLQLVDRGFGPVLLLHLEALHYTGADASVLAGVLFSVLAIAGAAGHQVAASMLGKTSARAIIAGSAIAAAAGLGVFGMGRTVGVLTTSMALFGLGVGTAMTTAFTAGGAVVPRHAHAASFGFLTGASLVGSALSPVLSGLAAARSMRVVFAAGVVVLGVLAIVVRRVMVEAQTIEAAPSEES